MQVDWAISLAETVNITITAFAAALAAWLGAKIQAKATAAATDKSIGHQKTLADQAIARSERRSWVAPLFVYASSSYGLLAKAASALRAANGPAVQAAAKELDDNFIKHDLLSFRLIEDEELVAQIDGFLKLDLQLRTFVEEFTRPGSGGAAMIRGAANLDKKAKRFIDEFKALRRRIDQYVLKGVEERADLAERT